MYLMDETLCFFPPLFLEQAESHQKHIDPGSTKLLRLKNFAFLFCFLVFSSKLGKQSLRFRASDDFLFWHDCLLYQNQNPVLQMKHWSSPVITKQGTRSKGSPLQNHQKMKEEWEEYPAAVGSRQRK